MAKLGQKLKRLRLQANLSQAELAAQLDMSRQTYAQIEIGERELTIAEAETLASIFGMSLHKLLDGERTSAVKKEKKSQEEPEGRIIMDEADTPKFKEVLLYVLEKVGAKPNIGETTLYKLLYFIDFDFYEKYEEQLTGAKYMRNKYGPTPKVFVKVIDEMQASEEVTRVKSKYFTRMQKKYVPLREPDLSQLSAREVKHIDETLARLADKNANELSDLSHKDIPWQIAEPGENLEYEAVFYRDTDFSVRTYDNEI